jgi:hypothetical protein
MRAVILLAGAALLLAGCGVFSKSEKREAACPRGVIPADSAKVTRFRDGPGRDLTDVVSEGEILDILVQCKYDKQAVNVDLQVAVGSTRGPADRSKVTEYDYFVAVVDPEQNILAKQPFHVRFEFKDNQTKLGSIEELEPHLPLKDVMKAPDYQIMIGFQLTPEELAWNREQRARQTQ